MPRATKEITVGANKIVLHQLPPRKAIGLWHYLMSIVVAALGHLGVPLDGRLLKADITLADAGRMAEKLFALLPETEFQKLIDRLLENAEVIGPSGKTPLLGVFDQVMGDSTVLDIYKLLFAAGELNFGNFIKEFIKTGGQGLFAQYLNQATS